MMKAKRRNLTEDQKKNIFAGLVTRFRKPYMILFQFSSTGKTILSGSAASPPATRVRKRPSVFWANPRRMRRRKRRLPPLQKQMRTRKQMEKRRKRMEPQSPTT